MAQLASFTDLIEAIALLLAAVSLLGFVWWLHRMVRPFGSALTRPPTSVEAKSKWDRFVTLLDRRSRK